MVWLSVPWFALCYWMCKTAHSIKKTTTHAKLSGQEVVNESKADLLNNEREAVVISLSISMHTGQIIMMTKMLTATDLRFYDFEAGAPIERWRSGTWGSS